MGPPYDWWIGRLEHAYAKKIGLTALESRIEEFQEDLDAHDSSLTTVEVRMRRLEFNLRVFMLQRRIADT